MYSLLIPSDTLKTVIQVFQVYSFSQDFSVRLMNDYEGQNNVDALFLCSFQVHPTGTGHIPISNVKAHEN